MDNADLKDKPSSSMIAKSLDQDPGPSSPVNTARQENSENEDKPDEEGLTLRGLVDKINLSKTDNQDADQEGKEPSKLKRSQSLSKSATKLLSSVTQADDSDVEGNENQSEAEKNAAKLILDIRNFSKIASKKVLDYNEGSLFGMEPQMEHKGYGIKFKTFLKYSIAIWIFSTIVLNAFLSFGTEKSQVLTNVNHNDYIYDLNQYPIAILFPLHWFLEMSRQDVVDRMECLVNKNDTFCKDYDELKCTVYDKKEDNYEYCMLRAQRVHGVEMKEFCIEHYIRSDVYDEKEKQSVNYFESYHLCLEDSGIKRGKKYCEDVINADVYRGEQDLYDCFFRHKVNITQFGEDYCRFKNPLDKEDGSASSGEITTYCVDLDDSMGDTDGDTCSSWYDDHPGTCGNYDTEEFIANTICCSCGGGETIEGVDDPYQRCLDGYEDLADISEKYTCDKQILTESFYEFRENCWVQECINDDSVGDSYGDTCSDWYDANSNGCGNYDTEEFSSYDMCCACGGGESSEPQFQSSNTDCSDAVDLITDRKECYQNLGQEKNVGFCDSKLLSDTTSFADAQNFYNCYDNAKLNTTDKSLCDNLYPLHNNVIGGSFRLLSCYSTFNINITEDVIQQKCLDTYRDTMYQDINNYQNCLVELGIEKTYDECLTNPYKVQLVLEEKKFIIQDLDGYAECMSDEGRREEEAYFCQQRYDHYTYFQMHEWQGYDTKEELRQCFEGHYMPLSPVYDCELKHKSDYEQDYQLRSNLTEEERENACAYSYNGECYSYWSSEECQYNFEYAEYSYDYGYIDVTPEEYMMLEYSQYCEPYVPDFTALNECLDQINYDQFYSGLNSMLQQFLSDRVAQSAQNYPNFNEENAYTYCDTVFEDPDQAESKILCYEQIEQPMGPDKCFILPRVLNDEDYHFNYFYKYLCLYMNLVDIDQEASSCLDIDNIDDLLLYERNQCLINYESKQPPVLTFEGKIWIYEQNLIVEEEEEDLSYLPDRYTNITLEQIQDFVCQNATNAIFSSSPFKERRGPKTKLVNQINFKMNCTVFQFNNITRENLMVYFTFDDSEGFQNQNGMSYYNDEFSSQQMIINRTDSNQQLLNLTYGEDFELIQVLSNRLYQYKSSQEVNLTSGEAFINFTNDPNTTKLFETYSQVVNQQFMPDQNVLAHQTLISQVDKNVTNRVFGIGTSFSDLELIDIEISKLNNKIKSLNKEDLVKDEVRRINSFRINLLMDFTEKNIRISYVWFVDIFSKLGGLNASINSIMAQFTFLFLISYFHSLSSMIHRKYKNKLKVQQIKQFQKVLKKEIIPRLREQTQQNERDLNRAMEMEGGEGDLGAGNQIILNNPEVNPDALKDLEQCEKAILVDYLDTYNDTKERLILLREIIKKYRPEALENVFEYNGSNLNEWEQTEHTENSTKRELYIERAKMSLYDIVQQVQGRMSFYNIYELIDNITANKIKIKKIRDQVRLAKKQNDQQQKIIDDSKKAIEDLKQKSQQQNDIIGRLVQTDSENKAMLKFYSKQYQIAKGISEENMEDDSSQADNDQSFVNDIQGKYSWKAKKQQ